MNARLLLVFNAGSSSLKYDVFEATDEGPRSRIGGAVRDIGRARAIFEHGGSSQAIDKIEDAGIAAALVLDRLFGTDSDGTLARSEVAASGHRVVHGGERFSGPIRVTVSAFDALKSLAPLAPLHNPQSLAVMEVVGEALPDRPMIAAFDTAFFHELPDAARHYAVPRTWIEQHGIRRYGFHGIAHQHLAAVLAAGGLGPRTITLHLGQGCSAAALLDGRPVDTSMGFTPIEGLVMGTRCGDLDPGVHGYLTRLGHSARQIDDALNRRSGLLGLSGISDDVRELLAQEADGHEGAKLALDVFCLRIRKYVGAYAAVLGGLDAIAIGGGIGENSPPIRSRALGALGWLGLELDERANHACLGEAARITTPNSKVAVQVVPVEEAPIIARAMLEVLKG